jgi:tetratricopeptide (TPR) repeat protein
MSKISSTANVAQCIAGSLPRCELALELLVTHRGNPSVEVDRALVDDPQCLSGHCLRAALIVLADADAARSMLAASVAVIEAASTEDKRARRHASAARAWLEGNSSLAAERYGAIVNDCPRDILALVVAHALDFRLGQRRMLRDRIAQVLPAWDAAVPGYASVLAMYAFGLEENGEYDRAERIARRALAIDPGLPAAIHVISHVMEMQGRTREGLEFLAATEPAWGEGTGFSVHLAWHRALFHLDAVDPRSALAVYDAQIAKANASDIHLTFTEAALRARKERLARALVAERAAQKPSSRLNQLLQQRLRTMSTAA